MAPARRTRILIVDDSAVMRSLLRAVVSADPTLEVAGTAPDGDSALDAMASVRPDLVLLDVEMPKMDGLATLRALRQSAYSTPVIMVSAGTQRGARVTIEALARGASDYVAKPANQQDRQSALRALAQDLLPKIHALTSSDVKPSQGSACPAARAATLQPSFAAPTVLVIGVSTGGPAALDVLLPALPAEFPIPVLIVQHMPELFTGLLADRLSQNCLIRIREASEGAPVLPGVAYLARGNWHMEIRPAHGVPSPVLHLHQGPLESHCRPAVDVLFRSAAAAYGAGALAIVLTGMGSDGLAGSRIICAAGGTVLAQDEASSAVWGMPRAVALAGLARRVLPLNAIAPEILRMVSRAGSESADLRGSTLVP
jgi:two-component system, chemotaxis family, protein-glutamate methylesterase/glutaminase